MRKHFIIFTVVIFLVLSTVTDASASGCSGDIWGWTWKNGTSDLSVQLFSDPYEPYTSSACFSWNYISPSVFIARVYYHQGNTTNYGCEIEVYDEDLPGTTLGQTAVYKKILFVTVQANINTFTGKVVKAVITLDSGSDANGLLQLGTAQINKTITHEFGHALALSHPVCTKVAIMHQTANTAYTSMTITDHDKDNLNLKWP